MVYGCFCSFRFFYCNRLMGSKLTMLVDVGGMGMVIFLVGFLL